ncbi:MAG TPA: CoA pyrophosphatase [Saprospiraceae bacterium]|nr:CoA pyrophosphatase [Saprospiraceae bacterium]
MDRIHKISSNILAGLPGKNAHQRLAPFAARLEYKIPASAQKAAVLILLYQKDEKYYFPLITRQSNHPEDKHKGQVALPGGRLDPTDRNTWETALRETVEEIGVAKDRITQIGALSSLYIPVSDHLVFPYVAFFDGIPDFEIQEQEISSLHEIDLDLLPLAENRKSQELKTTDGPVLKVPSIQINGLVIWGATGMILEEFTELLI